MKNSKRLAVSLIGLAVFIALALGSEPPPPPSKADGQVSNVRCKPDFGVIDGEMDAGVSVTLTVKNVGEAGIIEVTPTISASEGEWSREQKLQFGAGQSMNLTYFFHEPTVNVMNVQCRAHVSP
jgi:hypothetical protein